MSHLRLLHVTTILNGFKINKVLIDGEEAISLLPERMLRKVEKYPDDLVPINIVVMDFRCYLYSKGLSVKLRYPEVGFKPTGYKFTVSCNGNNNASWTADLIAKAHCVEN
ncbi:hypothetical protein Ahy_A01g002877 [Arachis hypogaea]|uniref:Uncharacterized protein n=1 Tax=Arachis hypogaea TaxID=3818 RepID=A0A445ERP5_ARAHY|nr:hypothetical protein Ahy_A01g002877 [Arachis hypogaea]